MVTSACLSLQRVPGCLVTHCIQGAAFIRPDALRRLSNACREETNSHCLAFTVIVFDVACLRAVSRSKLLLSGKVLLRRLCGRFV